MGHALRQAQRHWKFAQDDGVYGVPRDEILDGAYHEHLAKLITKSRPRADTTAHIQLTGDAASAADLMTHYAGSGGKPRLAPAQEAEHGRAAPANSPSSTRGAIGCR
ncbi:MAG: hypothetical protein U1F49_13410 [Rubrivivax sp.]